MDPIREAVLLLLADLFTRGSDNDKTEVTRLLSHLSFAQDLPKEDTGAPA